MQAVKWYGTQNLKVEEAPAPKLESSRDAIVKLSAASICGSDLHIYDGFIPEMKSGDIIGHEFMGEVVETGRDVKNFAPGDRVVVASDIACGECEYCQKGLWSLCNRSNPNGEEQAKLLGYATAGFYGYSHLFGGYQGAFAEYVRVPYADTGMFKVPKDLPDEKLLFLSDALPTGYTAAEYCSIQPGGIVAVWGCGAVGLMAMKCLQLMGAGRIIAIDRLENRLDLARQHCNAETLNYTSVNVVDALRDMTQGHGPDACLDAVGLEAHAPGVEGVYDRAKQAIKLETDRPHVLREAIIACRKGGTLSIAGVYSGLVDKFPIGVAFNKSLTFHMGQMNGQKYIPLLLPKVIQGEIDTSFLVTHRMRLNETPEAFRIFRDKEQNCVRVMLRP